MNNLGKVCTALFVTSLIVAVGVFTVESEAVSATALKTSKFVQNSVKPVKKRIITPNKARNFLNGLDIPTGDYEKTEDLGNYGKYEARSDYLLLETRNPDRYINNLTYYVRGDKFVAKAVELVLNVNDLSYKSNAVGELIEFSNVLTNKVTGKNLTPAIKKAIKTPTNGEWILNGYKIKTKVEFAQDEKLIKGEEPTSDHGAFSLTFLIEL